MKRVLLVALAVVLCIALVACSSTASTTSSAAAATSAAASASAKASTAASAAASASSASGKTYKVAVSLPPADNAWQASFAKFITQYLKDAGNIDATVKSATDAADQMNVISTFKSGGYDLIAILPVDGSQLTASVEDVFNSGVPTIVIDRDIDSDNKTAYVGGNNYDCGTQAAKYIAKFFDGKTDIQGVELRSYAGTAIDLERHNGFADEIKNYSNISMIGEADGEFNSQAGFEAMSNLLAANKKIDFVYTHDDETTTGAMTAITQAGRTDIQLITGTGGTVTALNEIKADNTIHKETSGYFPGLVAKGAADCISKYLSTGSVDKSTKVPGTAITKDNVSDYLQYGYE